MTKPPAGEEQKPPQLVAISLIQDARAYVECARVLDQHQRSHPRYFSPTYFLLCQAIELALKAQLAASGVPMETLRNDVGHNIDVALRYVQRVGFAPADDRFPELVQGLAPYHLDHSFRYRKGSGPHQLPAASEAAEIIHNVVEAVDRYVRSHYLATKDKKQRR